ncbi:MAG: hypothetical protein ABIH01_00430 [Candidatus Omnitrophota bacterium]
MRKMTTMILVLAFGLLSSGVFADDALDAVLRDVKMKAALARSYSADVKMTVKLGDKMTIEMAGKMLCKDENKIKVDMDILGGTQPVKQLTVCDGSTMWQYMKPMEVVYKLDLTKRGGDIGDIRDATQDMEQATMKFVKKDNIAGDAVYIIEGTPKSYIKIQDPQKYATMEIAIGVDDGLVRRLAIKDSQGNPTILEEYKNIKINIPIDDKEFAFTVPAGAKVEEK